MSNAESPESPSPGVGDWVMIWGRMEQTNPHPEDYRVSLFSHNEEYTAFVRRDHVLISAGGAPDFVPQCTSLYEVKRDDGLHPGYYVRCDRHDQHGERFKRVHGVEHYRWTDDQAAGYIEDRA